MRPTIERTAVRVVLVDALGRTLLFRGFDPARPEAGTWWFTPGGGIEAGETVGEAARREVLEETGIVLDGIGEPVLQQQIEFEFEGALVRQSEQFFVVRLPGRQPDPSDAGWTDLERRSVVESRWWPFDELSTTADLVYPTVLIDLLTKEPTVTEPASTTPPGPDPDHRRLGVDLFNDTWTMLESESRTRQDDDRMLHMAHASRHHWGEVGTAAHLARGEWLCSRVYAVLGRGEPSRYHAERALDLCGENSIRDWDLAFAYEAVARAHAVSGDAAAARAATEQALAAAEDIIDPEDRALVRADLETVPGQDRFW